MDVAGKPVLVVGLARSGVAAAQFLAAAGARVVATDRKGEAELEAAALSLRASGVTLELGGHRRASFEKAALVVVSPGVPWELPELAAARGAGVPVIAELELAFRHLTGTLAAVTGTKGKSTTTAALGAMLREDGRDARVGGNIGQPLIGLLAAATPATLYAVEASSFQLEGTASFRPKVAVFLNLSADHLDRHASFEAYAAAKARVFANQGPEDWAVVNADDPGVLALARRARSRLVAVRPTDAPRPSAGAAGAAGFDAGEARLVLEGRAETLFRLAALRLPGAHLAGDLLMAAVAARLLGAAPAAIARAAAAFRGLPHVLERVAEIGGVAFFNDSKATNVEAARRSLEAFTRPLLPIMGGRYKGGDFRELRAALAGRARVVFAIGEARGLLAEAFGGAAPVVPCASLEEAVERAFDGAVPGDAVLLAPGCASFDMFGDYAERGEAFRAAVRRLADAARAAGREVRE
jgi:UDP-N-acetylmuramoylalanine--D-glutamate ligase